MKKMNSGLIKQALLVSIAIFFLIQAGFQIEELSSVDFWRNLIEELKLILEQFWLYLKSFF